MFGINVILTNLIRSHRDPPFSNKSAQLEFQFFIGGGRYSKVLQRGASWWQPLYGSRPDRCQMGTYYCPEGELDLELLASVVIDNMKIKKLAEQNCFMILR